MVKEISGSREWTSFDLASLIEMGRINFLAGYERTLDSMGERIAAEPMARARMVAAADRVLADVLESLRAGRVRVGEGYRFSVHDDPEGDPAGTPHPREPLVAGSVLFDLVLRELVEHLPIGDEPSRTFTLALLALHQSLTMRLSEEYVAHCGRLLRSVHQAQSGERDRIARELHDRTGFWLSTSYRQLELLDIAAVRSSLPALEVERLTAARGAVRNAIHTVREMVSELRLIEPMQGLEDALLTAFGALSADGTTIRLNINGDEAWAPYAVKDEVLLIVREAVRNAVVHGHPRLVVVGVHIAPHELRVFVDDDGGGFDQTSRTPSGGLGLTSMRERAELMNGTLTISSVPFRGTHVELYVPLSGLADA
ncbi:hypothetical protein E1281_15675 [Actinomadura sp. KC345]|uniref:sensor histidine kinase n=1 Tax=Actinomadura sp. KC345 TaxID=2530371 RepID=UPI00104E81E1|nr:ATP-binding protein [Actinomadura sp. KC345]TDC54734.1 hypothetical protein E1281_15675 [Actinomadura sp. KC345]